MDVVVGEVRRGERDCVEVSQTCLRHCKVRLEYRLGSEGGRGRNSENKSNLFVYAYAKMT